MAKKMGVIDWIAIVLLLIGGINWGLVGFFGLDIVSAVFGAMTILARIVYGLVGVAAVYSIYSLVKINR